MRTRAVVYIFLSVFITALTLGAQKTMYNPTPIPFVIPQGFPKPALNIFKGNTVTEEGFQLGKKLFYDGRLSKNGEVSCGSCHQPFASFATYDHDLSHGVDDSFTTRNAMPLINLAWMREWHWDGGVNNIEMQPLAPITAANEMGEKLENVILKLRADSIYRSMFQSAFGNSNISSQQMLKALAQFTGSLVSANSKYDKVTRRETAFILPEQKGYEIFKANCNTCHAEPLFTDNSYRNNGVTLNRFSDEGRQRITGDKTDSLKFKVPTLRNVALTLPYMHDGRFAYLEKVLDHYTTLDTTLPNLDPALRKKIVLSEVEKKQLILFLRTLTDTGFTKNKRFLP